jgi:hypothetical protein
MGNQAAAAVFTVAGAVRRWAQVRKEKVDEIKDSE